MKTVEFFTAQIATIAVDSLLVFVARLLQHRQPRDRQNHVLLRVTQSTHPYAKMADRVGICFVKDLQHFIPLVDDLCFVLNGRPILPNHSRTTLEIAILWNERLRLKERRDDKH